MEAYLLQRPRASTRATARACLDAPPALPLSGISSNNFRAVRPAAEWRPPAGRMEMKRSKCADSHLERRTPWPGIRSIAPGQQPKLMILALWRQTIRTNPPQRLLHGSRLDATFRASRGRAAKAASTARPALPPRRGARPV